MSFKSDLRLLLKPYYWINILLALSYLLTKRITPLCQFVFGQTDCELDGRETEILFFLLIVVMIRTRKAGSVTMINYLTSSFVYTKIANLVLWFYADIRMGILYGVIFVLIGLVLPEPTYSGPENVTYFRGLNNMEEELKRDKKVTWMMCFYTAWHPACANFAPVYSELSSKYHLENLRFGKIDVGRYPEAAAKHRILDGALSKQLPTLILFQDAQEQIRRPQPDHKNKLISFLFSVENIKVAFDLTGLHKECKEKLAQKQMKTPAEVKKND